MNIPTRGNNTLDHVYSSVKDAYKAFPRPHLGLSDHISIMLVPAYHPPLRRSKPTQKTITVWPSDGAAVLQDCFGCTDWQVFREAAECEGELDLEEYTSAVLGYISKCVEDVTTTKTVTCYPNQKPWLNAEVRSLLKARDAAFRSGDSDELRRARRELTAGVKRAKAAYAQKIQGHFSSQDPQSMWRGIKCITDYKSNVAQSSKDPSLPETLNTFYARFENPDTPPSTRLPHSPGEAPLSVTPAEVRRTLRRINPRKAAGLDNIPGQVLKDCADQLSDVLADIFNASLLQAAVPPCLKTATIIPVPKSSTVTGLNDYRPVALTPIVTKCFERLVQTHIKATINITVDPHQYAYRKNQSTEDAISSVVHTALTHLEQKDSYVRMLFVDFTSAFNTMIPQTLITKLSSLGLSSSLCNWVLDFLTNRPQSVRIHNISSPSIILSTGSPQGCVLSPLLFTLLTYDCSPLHPGCHIVKFADDTAVVGCITNRDESSYRQEVEHLEGWCRENNLCINVKKTKEMIVDFRRGQHAHLPLHIGGSAVEVVDSYRYLGVHLTSNLTWSNNTSTLVRKAHQRLYFLRRLRRAGLGSVVLTSFYRCVVESVVCSSINVWHGSCSAADRKALQRVVKAAQRIVGVSFPSTTDIYTSRCRKRATCIRKDPTHPAHALFVPLPSGRRLRSIKCKTTRLRNSFIPEAVRLLNST
uniref:Reverse transcriptase domain-containing protein n=1 Tax=Astyanax mexicanus TaxID=7994 RepID=A0A3B1IEK6_ASTMX